MMVSAVHPDTVWPDVHSTRDDNDLIATGLRWGSWYGPTKHSSQVFSVINQHFPLEGW